MPPRLQLPAETPVLARELVVGKQSAKQDEGDTTPVLEEKEPEGQDVAVPLLQ